MEDLFVKPLNFEKTAMKVHLDKDPNKWVREIIRHFLEKYPYIQDETIMLDWKKKDVDRGYAVGVLKVLGGHIPVIVQDYKLSPLDIFIMDDIYLPFNDTVIKTLMEAPDAFGGVASSTPKTNNNLFQPALDDSSFSPSNSGRYGLTNGISEIRPAKTASVIDQISTVDRQDVINLVKKINDDPAVKLAFEKNNTLEVVEKLANKSLTSPGGSLQNYIRNLDVDRQYIYSDEKGNHFLKQASSTLDKSWTTRISEDEAREYSLLTAEGAKTPVDVEKTACFPVLDSNDQALRVNEEGQWQLVSRFEEKIATHIDLPETHKPSTGDMVSILTEDGATKPYEVEKVEKVASETICSKKLMDDDKKSVHFNKLGHYNVSDKDLSQNGDDFEGDVNYIPKIGEFGIIVSGDYASEPFEVTSLMKTASEPTWEIEGFTGIKKLGFHVLRIETESDFEPHEDFKNHFYVPKTACFVPLSESNDSLEQTLEKKATQAGQLALTLSDGLDRRVVYYDANKQGFNLEKLSSGKYLASRDVKFLNLNSKECDFEKKAEIEANQHYVGRDNAGFYYLKGREFDKYASHGHDKRNLSQNDAAWALIHCGATVSDLKKMADLQGQDITPLEGKINAPQDPKTVVNKAKNAYNKYARQISIKIEDLVKEAAVLTDKASVDAILSLGLLKRHNIEEYLEVVPTYEQVMSELSKLLLTSRLGLSQLPPEPVKKAMDSLTDVVIMLKRIRSTLKEVK